MSSATLICRRRCCTVVRCSAYPVISEESSTGSSCVTRSAIALQLPTQSTSWPWSPSSSATLPQTQVSSRSLMTSQSRDRARSSSARYVHGRHAAERKAGRREYPRVQVRSFLLLSDSSAAAPFFHGSQLSVLAFVTECKSTLHRNASATYFLPSKTIDFRATAASASNAADCTRVR